MANKPYNFSDVPLWNPENPKTSFEILSDKVSGRVPVTRLESWREYTELLEHDFFNRPNVQLAFRGQRRFDWELAPSLGRLAANGIVTEILANEQLGLFRKAIRGRILDHSLLEDGPEDDELWSIGQHHGLMTPMLDWSYSPYVGLFFAFEKEDKNDENDNPYRVVYALNKTFVSNDDVCPEIRVFEPKKDDYGRLVSQAGLFTFSPYDSTIENKLADVLSSEDFKDGDLAEATEQEQASILAKYICKIYIKNENQSGCLKYLRRMNVHHGSLFPDVQGAANFCNIYITETKREEQLTDQMTEPPSSIPNANEVMAGMREELLEYIREKENSVEPEEENILSVRELLSIPDETQEMAQNALDTIAQEISKAVAKSTLVDWHERDALQAEIKNKTRVLLRKFGYPIDSREYVVENILNVIKDQEDTHNE